MVKFMNTFENAVKKALSIYFGENIISGGALADAPPGSLFFSVEKISYRTYENDDEYSDGECGIKLRIRYFPFSAPNSSLGDDIFRAVKKIALAGSEYVAANYECKLFKSHADVTAEYKIPEYYMDTEFSASDTNTDAGSEDENGSDNTDGSFFMKEIKITFLTEGTE